VTCPECAHQMVDPFRGPDQAPFYECPECGCLRHRLWVAGYNAGVRASKAVGTAVPPRKGKR
jgi:transposase